MAETISVSVTRANLLKRFRVDYGDTLDEEAINEMVLAYDKYLLSGAFEQIFSRGATEFYVTLSERQDGPTSICSFVDRERSLMECDVSLPSLKRQISISKDLLLMTSLEVERVMSEALVLLHTSKVRLISLSESNFRECVKTLQSKIFPLPASFAALDASKGAIAIVGFTYYMNSCYLDSVLMTTLFSSSNFWRENVLEVELSEETYSSDKLEPKLDLKTSESKSWCIKSPKNLESYLKYAKRVQNQLATDHLRLSFDRRNTVCSRLRELLDECVTGLRVKGKWVYFSDYVIYSALADIFPGLKLLVPKRKYNSEGEELSLNFVEEVSVSMSDYLLKPFGNEDRLEIDFSLIDSEILVFFNGGAPRVRKLNEVGEEITSNVIQGTTYEVKLTKVRAFGEYILDGRYRLVGVTTLEGVSANKEGGDHYTSHFLSEEGFWYKYDDTVGVAAPIGTSAADLPVAGVWEETSGKMPSMYFYARSDMIPN